MVLSGQKFVRVSNSYYYCSLSFYFINRYRVRVISAFYTYFFNFSFKKVDKTVITKEKAKKYLYQIGTNRSWGVLPHSSVSLGANGAGTIVITTPSTFDFLVTAISGRSTGTYLLSFLGAGKSELLNNKPLHSSTVVGTGNLPYPLPCPIILRRTSSFVIDVSDLSGAANTVLIQLHGMPMYKESDTDGVIQKYLGMIPYFYTTDSTFTLSATDGVKNISLINSHDFLITQLSYSDTGSATTIQIKLQSGDGRTLHPPELYIDLQAIAGGAQYPKKFEHPLPLFGGNTFAVTAKDTAGANTLYLTFGGIALYK